jgi:hypothetical protein
MKTFHFYFLVIVMLTVVQQASSQMSVGVKTGVNVADAYVTGPINDFLPELQTNTGFTAGVWVEVPMLNGFSFRPEINYTQKGFRAMGDLNFLNLDVPAGLGVRTRLNTMEVPLLVKFSHGGELAKAYVILGPSVSYNTDAIARPTARLFIDFNIPGQELNLSNDIFRRWELSATLGLGGELKAGHGKIFGDVRYNHGVSTLLNNPIVDLDIRNKSFSIHAGYAYTF